MKYTAIFDDFARNFSILFGGCNGCYIFDLCSLFMSREFSPRCHDFPSRAEGFRQQIPILAERNIYFSFSHQPCYTSQYCKLQAIHTFETAWTKWAKAFDLLHRLASWKLRLAVWYWKQHSHQCLQIQIRMAERCAFAWKPDGSTLEMQPNHLERCHCCMLTSQVGGPEFVRQHLQKGNETQQHFLWGGARCM